jgi:hypothetical protein
MINNLIKEATLQEINELRDKTELTPHEVNKLQYLEHKLLTDGFIKEIEALKKMLHNQNILLSAMCPDCKIKYQL